MRDRDFLFGFVSLFPRSLVSWWGRDFCSFGFSMSGILLTGTRVFWPSRWRRRHLVRCSRHPLIRNDTLMINRYQSISIQTYTRSMTAEVQDEPLRRTPQSSPDSTSLGANVNVNVNLVSEDLEELKTREIT